jgi:hypothetical protein
MDRIHLYNTETGLRRNLFAGIFHEVLTHQHPNCDVVTAKDGTAPQPIPFALEGTEHIVLYLLWRSSARGIVNPMLTTWHRLLANARSNLSCGKPKISANHCTRQKMISRLTSMNYEGTFDLRIIPLFLEAYVVSQDFVAKFCRVQCPPTDSFSVQYNLPFVSD